MKTCEQCTLVGILGVLAAMAAAVLTAAADESSTVAYNDQAGSIVLNKTALKRLGDGFPSWKIKQMTLPAEAERLAASIGAKDAWIAECSEWMNKFFKKDYLPDDLGKHLVAMRAWGTVRKETEQPRLCDVFIVRFTKGPLLIHVQESPYNVVITVVDETLARRKAAGEEVAAPTPKDLVIQTAQAVLKKALWPEQDKRFHQFPDKDLKIGKLSKIGWIPPSLAREDERGRLLVDLAEAKKLGTTGVAAETDGSFVRFEIRKCTGGSRGYEDPYQERFAPKE